MDSDICHFHGFIGLECQFYGGNYRCHADLSVDGAYHGSGAFYRALNDFELMKRSLKSFLIATLFSVTTATIYLSGESVAEGQSELLARTSPTIYDVFIALWVVLAGIMALSTKEKGNVIPGVAIATALMPPLVYGRLRAGNG